MSDWVKTQEGIVGLVVGKTRRPSGQVLAIDVNGEGDIWYAEAKTTTPVDVS